MEHNFIQNFMTLIHKVNYQIMLKVMWKTTSLRNQEMETRKAVGKKKSMKLIISFEEMNKTGKLLTRQTKKREHSNK